MGKAGVRKWVDSVDTVTRGRAGIISQREAYFNRRLHLNASRTGIRGREATGSVIRRVMGEDWPDDLLGSN